ncbi:MAG: hypothetical protein HY911_00725 [Desulfobacterales bacterium]|nr:hypothetical protein [Desulfobacterales bacterium]
MNDWANYIQEGRHYLMTAHNGHKRNTVFNNELVGNLIGLSLEKLLVGLCLYHGFLPADHTLTGIVAEVHRRCPLDPSLMDGIRALDRVQNLCALDVQAACAVGDRQIEALLTMNEHIAVFVEKNIGQAPADRAVAL